MLVETTQEEGSRLFRFRRKGQHPLRGRRRRLEDESAEQKGKDAEKRLWESSHVRTSFGAVGGNYHMPDGVSRTFAL
jgi:hypothetical protein